MSMNKRVITHVFAAVQNLEKSMKQVKELMATHRGSLTELESLIPQQELVLKKMRRTANRLQFELAREDWNSAIRSLRIFYGLNHLIRKDLMSTQRKLGSEQRGVMKAPPVVEEKAITYH